MSTFRTLELSNPQFEKAHLRFITIKSPHLKGRGDITVFVPPNIMNYKNLPLVILLHGVYGSAWSWPYGAGVHIQALEMIEQGTLPPMIIAMPSDGLWGDGSAYLAHHDKNFEQWIVEDVPLAVREIVPQVSNRSPQFIGGLSMGGYGALRLAALYPNLFVGVSAHSSITAFNQMKLFIEEDLTTFTVTDEQYPDVIAALLYHREKLPAIRFDCGKEDLLIEENRKLHQQMQQYNIPHRYFEYSGGHEWNYWTLHIRKSLLFFAELL
ncbi:esterase family protein [Olivibacter sp. SDN3]|uniref:alpha/beta hydrolase n=1 Tax=Olivibacter sp. SDN3 TaxID=2764720 RepID=UPI001651A278|nr:alpha/beta hydrolase-fold protein [Olivibacter sp. SDN3]QNL48306.1 esterase family protein [Olivibacter sp. SDN3]